MNPFNLQDITTFLAIVDSGSLTQAAERLEVAPGVDDVAGQRARDSSLAQVEQQILMTELRRLRNVGLSQIERNTDPLSSVGKTGRRTPSKL